MNLIELSKENLKEDDKKLYNLIIKDYNYDLVIFIAKGSFYIGNDLAKFNNCQLLEIFATRKGNKLKKIVSPLMKIIPLKLKKVLRKKEFNSNYHQKNSNRNIEFDEELWKKFKNVKSILLVDDSVDTGYSILYAKEKIEEFFKEAEIRVAALNCFKKSLAIVKTNYYLYKDTMLIGPWSNDSKENKIFKEEYYMWHNSL